MNEVRCPRNLSHLRSAPRSQATWYRHLEDPRSSDRDRVVLIVTSVGVVHYVVWTHSEWLQHASQRRLRRYSRCGTIDVIVARVPALALAPLQAIHVCHYCSSSTSYRLTAW